MNDIPVFWGREIFEPGRAHARETLGGQPVPGFAICGCRLGADVADDQVVSGAYDLCSRCLDFLANRVPGVDYPLWTR
jgi:hypothetical protein